MIQCFWPFLLIHVYGDHFDNIDNRLYAKQKKKNAKHNHSLSYVSDFASTFNTFLINKTCLSSYWDLWQFQNSRRQIWDNRALCLKSWFVWNQIWKPFLIWNSNYWMFQRISLFQSFCSQDIIIVLFFSCLLHFVVGESSWLDISSFVWCYHTGSGFSCRRLSLCDDKLLSWTLVKIVYLLHCGWHLNRI